MSGGLLVKICGRNSCVSVDCQIQHQKVLHDAKRRNSCVSVDCQADTPIIEFEYSKSQLVRECGLPELAKAAQQANRESQLVRECGLPDHMSSACIACGIVAIHAQKAAELLQGDSSTLAFASCIAVLIKPQKVCLTGCAA